MEFFTTVDVEKNYAAHKALDKVSIQVSEGKIFGLLGPNGAGKTTLIRIINQITAPDNGEVFFNGEKLQAKHIAQIGYLPEERGLYKKMKVGEQALYLAQLKGLNRKDALKKLKIWFEKFEIQGWWDKKVEELSKGMQQKVQFIVTVLHDPKLLIFDEPFSGFDPINTNLLKKEILELKKQGATIIFSTHNMASVEEICDDIALMNRSKVILEGNVNAVRNKYKPNVYDIMFSGSFSKMEAAMTADYEIKEYAHHTESETHKLVLQLKREQTTNELITHLMQFGNITEFSEQLPSMNDIFIQAVGEVQKES